MYFQICVEVELKPHIQWWPLFTISQSVQFFLKNSKHLVFSSIKAPQKHERFPPEGQTFLKFWCRETELKMTDYKYYYYSAISAFVWTGAKSEPTSFRERFQFVPHFLYLFAFGEDLDNFPTKPHWIILELHGLWMESWVYFHRE